MTQAGVFDVLVDIIGGNPSSLYLESGMLNCKRGALVHLNEFTVFLLFVCERERQRSAKRKLALCSSKPLPCCNDLTVFNGIAVTPLVC